MNTRKIVVAMACVLAGWWAGTKPLSGQQLPQPFPNQSVQNGDEDALIRQLDLKETSVVDAARIISELSGLNVVATQEAGSQTVTLYLQNTRAIDAIQTLTRVAGLLQRKDPETGTIRFMTAEEYQEDLIVRRDDVTRVFTLLHPNALSVASAIQDLYGPRVQLSIRSFDDDILLQQGAAVSTGLGFGGGFNRTGNQGFNNAQGGFQNNLFGGGFGGGLGGGFGGGFGGFAGGFGGMGGMGGGFGGGMGGFGGQNLMNRRNLSIREQLLEDELSPEALRRLENALRSGQQTDGELTATEVSRASQTEQVIFVTLNRSHNLVIVRTGDLDAMASIEQLIQEIDRPTPQVLLEMQILEVTVDDNFRSVFDFQFNNGPLGPTVPNQNANNPFLQNAATAAQNVLGAGNFPVQGGTFVYQFLNDNLRARIEMLKTDNRAETVAAPLLLASNNRPARIFVGEERVLVRSVNSTVVTPTVGAATTGISPITELVDIGTNLFILPKINADRTVTLIINQENSTVNAEGTTIPVSGQNGEVIQFPIDTVDTASVSGTVVGRDGLSLAVGGLIRDTWVDNEQKVPVLGSLPVLGLPFRRTVRERSRRELILLITPHVITTPVEGQVRTVGRVNELSGAIWKRDAIQPFDQRSTVIEQPLGIPQPMNLPLENPPLEIAPPEIDIAPTEPASFTPAAQAPAARRPSQPMPRYVRKMRG